VDNLDIGLAGNIGLGLADDIGLELADDIGLGLDLNGNRKLGAAVGHIVLGIISFSFE